MSQKAKLCHHPFHSPSLNGSETGTSTNGTATRSASRCSSPCRLTRASSQFTRAVGKMAHLVAARHMWLFRLGVVTDRPESWFPSTTLDQLPAAVEAIEQRWTAYLARLTDSDLTADFVYTGSDDRRYRWRLLDLLTQVFGHAWYHRGQIAMLVKDLGGDVVDTDYIFWNRPMLMEDSDQQLPKGAKDA